MPALKTVDKQPTDIEKDATKKAIQRLIDLGYIHNDLHWRHVGFYGLGTKSSPLKAVLFDLSNVDKIDTNEKNESLNRMYKCLNIIEG